MTPPRIARRLVRRAVPPDTAGRSVLADLDDEFNQRCEKSGRRAAARWYWRQAFSMWWWSAWSHPQNSYHQPRGDVLSNAIGDFRYAIRLISRFPGQSALIVATLAVGIGVTTIGFSFADTTLIRGLPIADPARTVIVFGIDEREPERRGGVYAADVLELQRRSRTVSDLATWSQARSSFRRAGTDPLRVTISRVYGDLFGIWGARTHLGRTFNQSDFAAGAPPAAVVAHQFWREALAGDPGVIGRTVFVDGTAITIVGVLSDDVEFGTFASISLWLAHRYEDTTSRDLTPAMLTARLAPGATVEEVAAEFRTLAGVLAQEYPDSNRGRQLLVFSARRAIGGPNFALVLSLLVGISVLVTVIASVNVAGVLMARAVVRQQEFATRTALGAARGRLLRQVTFEGLVLALLSGLGGVAVAEFGLRIIRSIEAEPIFQQIVLDWHELAFVSVLAVLTPLFFSLLPALTTMRVDLVAALNASGPRTSHAQSRRTRDVLAVGQLAIAIALAIVGGLVARTGAAITWAPNGFESRNVLTFTLALDQHSGDVAVRREVLRLMKERIRAGTIEEVGVLDALPAIAGEQSIEVWPDGIQPDDRMRAPLAHVVSVDASAFAALRVPVLDGRTFTDGDIEGGTRVAMVTREAAERLYGGVANAIGRGLAVLRDGAPVQYQVVGVTGDVRDTDPENGIPLRVWTPLSAPSAVNFVVRSAQPEAAAFVIRQPARELLPDVPVEGLESYDRGIARYNGGNRIAMGMLISFVAVALLFAGTGLYATIAVATNMRRGEFATRVALGASPRDVAGLVVHHTVRLLAWGLVPGVAIGLALASAMRGLLYGVTPADPLTLTGVMSVLAVIAIAASLGPALRSARMDIVQTLRRG